MRVKVKDTWYECEPGQPIMVELKDGDKANIANMSPQANKYAMFHDEDSKTMSTEEMFQWMDK